MVSYVVKRVQLYFFMAASVSVLSILSCLLPIFKTQYGLTNSTAGLLFAVGLSGMLICKFIAGILSDHFGGEIVLVLAATGQLTSSLQILIYPGIITYSLSVILMLSFFGFVWPASMKISLTDAARQQSSSALQVTFLCLGVASRAGFLSSLLTNGFLLEYEPYKVIVALASLISLANLLFGLYVWAIIHEEKERKAASSRSNANQDLSGELEEEQDLAKHSQPALPVHAADPLAKHESINDAISPSADASSTSHAQVSNQEQTKEKKKNKGVMERICNVLRWSRFVRVTCLNIGLVSVLYLFDNMAPLMLHDTCGLSGARSARTATLFPTGILLGIVIAGAVYTKVNRKHKLFLSVGSLLLSSVALIVLSMSATIVTSAPALLLLGFGLSVPLYGTAKMAFVEAGDDAGTAFGVIEGITGLFCIAIQALAGHLSEKKNGWTSVCLIMVCHARF